MSDDIFTDEIVAEASRYDNLGPAYFASRAFVERYMEGAESASFEPIVRKAADDFYGTLLESVEAHLLSNTECNLQGAVWRQVDEIVLGILSGKKWVMERYALGSRYDCEDLRAAVAKHIPAELQDKRVGDLKEKVERLEKDLAFYKALRS